MLGCKSIRERLRSCRDATLLRSRRRSFQQMSSAAPDGEDVPSSPGSSTPAESAVHRTEHYSSERVNRSLFSTCSPKDGPLGLSWVSPTTPVASPCGRPALELNREPLQNSEDQRSTYSESTISTSLSETSTLVQSRTEEQPLLGYVSSSEAVLSGDGQRSAWSDWSSDEPETHVEEKVKKQYAQKVITAIRFYCQEFSLNPFRRRPQHLKPAIPRFQLD